MNVNGALLNLAAIQHQLYLCSYQLPCSWQDFDRASVLASMKEVFGTKTVELADLTEMRKTDSFGETRLVLHVPSSS